MFQEPLKRPCQCLVRPCASRSGMGPLSDCRPVGRARATNPCHVPSLRLRYNAAATCPGLRQLYMVALSACWSACKDGFPGSWDLPSCHLFRDVAPRNPQVPSFKFPCSKMKFQIQTWNLGRLQHRHFRLTSLRGGWCAPKPEILNTQR